MFRFFFFQPVHAFGNGILMRTGKSGENQSATVRTSLINLHSRKLLILLTNMGHMGKVQIWLHTLGVHIKSQRHNVHISGTLSVSKQRTFNTVCACQKSHFRISHSATSVIVWMKGNHYVLPVFQILTHVFYLACINMGHRMLYRNRQVNNCLSVTGRLPDIQHCITYF